MKKLFFLISLCLLSLSLFIAAAADDPSLQDGTYSAIFTTDSSMFKVNEAYEDRGTLTVKAGQMTIHVSLSSKNILNLFPGLAEDAKKEDAVLLEPTTDEVTYSDGFQDTVYGFDIPVPHLDEDFDLALLGKKGKWYDHKVSVSDPIPLGNAEISDGNYLCDVTLTGGSGKAFVQSPAALHVENGIITAEIVWSSKNYEYMIVDDVRYEPVSVEENSVFEIPVVLDTEMSVSASTIAMSQPHLISYTLYFDSAAIQDAE